MARRDSVASPGFRMERPHVTGGTVCLMPAITCDRRRAQGAASGRARVPEPAHRYVAGTATPPTE